jgi:hypothetical protein
MVRRLQAKLRVNTPGDQYEHEADRVAEQVFRMPEPRRTVSAVSGASGSLQRKCACGGTCSKCQGEEPDYEHKRLQMKSVGPNAAAGIPAPPIVHQVLRSPGQPLDAATRSFMEPRFGRDFSEVRVHADDKAAESARAVGAKAYTVGSEIVLGEDGKTDQRIMAHELAHTIQQGSAPLRGTANPQEFSTRAETTAGSADLASVAISSVTSGPMLSRACADVTCPPVEFPIPAYGVIWQEAERCLQERYAEEHRGNTIGFNGNWAGLIGKTPHEQQAIDFFRSHFTAKGYKPKGETEFTDKTLEREGAKQRQAEPDIIDFTQQTIMEITTPAGVPYRAGKVIWEAGLATQLMDESRIGSPVLWQPGWWRPSPCYQMPGTGGKGFYRAWSQGGVLTYLPVSDVTEEAFALALAAAAAAAARNIKNLRPPPSPQPIHDPPIQSDPVFDALIVTALIALAIFLLPEELAAAIVIGIVRLAAAILALLGGMKLAFGAGGGDGGEQGSGSPGKSGGAAGKPEGKDPGAETGAGKSGTQTGKQGTEKSGAAKGAGTGPADESVRKLMEIIHHMYDKDGDLISPEDAERLLALGAELLQQLQAADAKDPNAIKLKDLSANMLPVVEGALEKVREAKGKKGGGQPGAVDPGAAKAEEKHGEAGTGGEKEPKGKKKDEGKSGQHEKQGKGGAGAREESISADLVPTDTSGLVPFQFNVASFNPNVPRTRGDKVELTISGSVGRQRYRLRIAPTFDYQEEDPTGVVTHLHLDSDLQIKGTDRFISKDIQLISSKKPRK